MTDLNTIKDDLSKFFQNNGSKKIIVKDNTIIIPNSKCSPNIINEFITLFLDKHEICKLNIIKINELTYLQNPKNLKEFLTEISDDIKNIQITEINLDERYNKLLSVGKPLICYLSYGKFNKQNKGEDIDLAFVSTIKNNKVFYKDREGKFKSMIFSEFINRCIEFVYFNK